MNADSTTKRRPWSDRKIAAELALVRRNRAFQMTGRMAWREAKRHWGALLPGVRADRKLREALRYCWGDAMVNAIITFRAGERQ